MHELEARWTDVFWVEVAPTLGLRSPAPEPSIDELPVLEARVSALEEMEARHGALTLAWSSPGELPRARSSIDLEALEANARRVSPLRALLDGGYHHRAVTVARTLIERAAPIEIDVRIHYIEGVLLVLIAAAAAPGVASFSVRGETFWDSFWNRREIEIGDESFDGAFLVEGDAWAARAVLDPATRAALLLLGANHSAELHVAPSEICVGTVQIPIGEEPSMGMIDALITVLRSATRTPIRHLRSRESG